MPIYEYRCDDCGNTFDMLQRFSDAPVETCDLCGAPVRKVLHPAAIHFKGSGFYTTDYARRSSSSPSTIGGDGGGDGSDTSHIAGGTDEVPTFKASDKCKAENRQKKAERVAKAQSQKSSSSSSKKS